MISVNVLAKPVSIENGVWSSADVEVANTLNNWLRREKETATIDHPLFFVGSPVEPWPDMTIAQEAVKAWSGEIIDEGEAPEHEPDRVY